jgi:hypothetical protein
VTDRPARPERPQRSGRDRVAAAATAVVVLVLGIVFAVVRSDREADGSTSRPTAAQGVQPCGAGDLVPGAARTETAAGTTYLTATLELAGDVEPCRVSGYPSVIVLSGGRPAGVGTVADRGLGEAQELVVLPDRPARVTLGWAVSHYCGPIVNDTIRIWVASDLPVEIGGFGPTSCSPGEGRPPVRVGPFTYVDPTAEQGTVTGVVTLNSGPGPGTGEFVTSGVVQLEGAPDGYRAPIGTDGSYELEVPAGRYRVTVSTHQFEGGRAFAAGAFDVVGGELNQLNITLPLR